MLVAATAPVDWEPDGGLDPDHAPDAVHAVTLLDDQVSVELPPLATVVGFAASDTDGDSPATGGTAFTLTWTAAVAVPPLPVHVNEYLALSASAPVDSVPDSDLDPDQPSDAVHDVALLEVHVSVELPPAATEVGLAEIETVGAGGRGGTSIVTDVEVVPPSPLHVSKKVPAAESGPVA